MITTCPKCRGTKTFSGRNEVLPCARCGATGTVLNPTALRAALLVIRLAACDSLVAEGREMLRVLALRGRDPNHRAVVACRANFAANRASLNALRALPEDCTFGGIAKALGRTKNELSDPTYQPNAFPVDLSGCGRDWTIADLNA